MRDSNESLLLKRITELERTVNKLMLPELGSQPVWLSAPLTSTSWDGDSFSTTAKTLIDLSAVFGVPAGVKAVLVNVYMRDSGSAANDCLLVLSPNNTSGSGFFTRCTGLTNDSWHNNSGMVIPCDANGDLYYQITASGASTMDIYIMIWAYWK